MAQAGGPANVLRLRVFLPERDDPDTLVERLADTTLTGIDDEIHPRLQRALLESSDADGRLMIRDFIRVVSNHYAEHETERRAYESTLKIASDELSAQTLNLGTDEGIRLQAILDHVKDAILACDENGRIEILNRTAERFFGVSQEDRHNVTIDMLLPGIAPRGDVPQALEDLAASHEDTRRQFAAREMLARHQQGQTLPSEILVSKMRLSDKPTYVICVRDTAERTRAEIALKDSEARYRVLVENAPEVVVVFDIDTGLFVDCNENALEFFKATRAEMLVCGPENVSPPNQADGTPSFGVARGYIQAALDGETPVFEWIHRDTEGNDIPCEVRLVRLPSSAGRLIRGSIIDITDRKRSEHIAAGERRAFERIASSGTLASALDAITDVIEQVLPDSVACIRLYDSERRVLTHAGGRKLPREYLMLMEGVPAEVRYGSCAAAVVLGRQIIVPDVDKDPFWEHRRAGAVKAGLHACWSTPIKTADGRVLGTYAVYMKRVGLPARRDLELMGRMTQLARIAIERRRAEDALRDSEQRFRRLFENVVEGVYQVTREGHLLSANPALVKMLGYRTLAELQAIGSTRQLYVYPSERDALLDKLARLGELVGAEYQLKRKDGSIITVSENARANRDAAGRLIGFEGTIADITERKSAESRLSEQKERAQVTLQSIADAVISTDRDGTIDYMNPIAESLTGWSAAEVVGKPVGDVVRLVSETSRTVIPDPVARALKEASAVALSDQTTLVSRLKHEIGIQANVAPIRDGDGLVLGAVMVFHDVSRERSMKRLLSYQAQHDALTGLINRREFENRLDAALDATRSNPDVKHAMVYVDLDQFKVVNDTCGHPAGDQLLKQVTGLLQTRVRASDVIARLGGDEFGVLLEHCDPATAIRLADGLRQAIRDYRFVWQGQTLQIGASIGIVEITDGTQSIAELMSAADMACYSAKDGGRNRVQLYDPASASARHREMRWVSRLTRASDEGQLDIVFQPIVAVAADPTSRPHYELLLRLVEEDGRLVLPHEFIPAAERYNVMPVLDRWMVERVLEEIVPSRRDGVHEPPFTVAINLSGTTLSDQAFLESLIEQLEEHEPTPGVLCFEITETAAISNLASASYIMRELTSRGCLVSLDDFGTGLSSFNYLRTLPVHYLKIDGQFVQNVANDPVDQSLVEAIVQVGKAMGIHTIAERVETVEVLETLKRIGVGFVQGYLLGKPESMERFPYRRTPAAAAADAADNGET